MDTGTGPACRPRPIGSDSGAVPWSLGNANNYHLPGDPCVLDAPSEREKRNVSESSLPPLKIVDEQEPHELIALDPEEKVVMNNADQSYQSRGIRNYTWRDWRAKLLEFLQLKAGQVL